MEPERATPSPLEDWHPDVDTAVVWSAYARKQGRDDLGHWARVVGMVVTLTALGFAAVIAAHHLLRG